MFNELPTVEMVLVQTDHLRNLLENLYIQLTNFWDQPTQVVQVIHILNFRPAPIFLSKKVKADLTQELIIPAQESVKF
jgi:hypothetical protein